MRPGLSRWLPLLLFAGLAVLLYAGVRLSGRADRDALPSPLIGKRAPSFALPVLHEPQRIFRSSELRGASYVLNVWGSWCPECQTEHDVLTAFAETKRVRVIGYNWKDEPADALRWLQRFGNPYWLVLTDLPGRTAIDFGIYGAPETFLIDGQGMVRWKHVGPLNETIVRQELIPALQRAERTQ